MSLTGCSHLKDSWIHACEHDQRVTDLQTRIAHLEREREKLIAVAKAAQAYVRVIGDDTKQLDALVDTLAALDAGEKTDG